MTTQLMYVEFIRRKFGLMGEDSQKKSTLKFDGAIFVEEKLTSEQVMKAAAKPEVVLEEIKDSMAEGKTL